MGGPWVRRAPGSGFPFEEGWFKAKSKGKGGGGGNARGKNTLLYRRRKPSNSYGKKNQRRGVFHHAAMTDAMFIGVGFDTVLPPPSTRFSLGGENNIIVLGNAFLSHHGCDAQVRVPETNTKKYTMRVSCDRTR